MIVIIATWHIHKIRNAEILIAIITICTAINRGEMEMTP